jgi:anti-anti-sigma regulatory factor
MITVLAFEDEYDLSLRERLRHDLETVRTEDALVFDLTAVSYCDAACVAEFVQFAYDRKKEGASPIAIVPSAAGKRVFDVIGFGDPFSFSESVEAVLRDRSTAADTRHAVPGYESLPFGESASLREYPSASSD